jgi:uncharacterized cupredoxin-like copper-binding protein
MKLRNIAVIAAILLMAAGCSKGKTTDDSSSGKAGTPISATLKDFAMTADPNSTAAGDLTFNINNVGPSLHELVIFKTDLAEDALPLGDDGNVNEEGEGITHITEQENIDSGSTVKLNTNLKAGTYVLICNISGHYKSGMHTSFSVT